MGEIDISQGGEITALDDTNVRIIVPKGAVEGNIRLGLSRVHIPNIGKDEPKTPVIVYEITAKRKDTGETVTRLKKPIKLRLHLTSIAGVVDSTSGRVRLEEAKQKLSMAFWNNIRWAQIGGDIWTSGTDVFAETNVSHLTQYGIVVKGVGEVSLTVAPNPVTPRGSVYNYVDFNLNNTNNEEVEIKIWDITGVLGRTIRETSSSIRWDCKDEYGELVEGGVWIYQVKLNGKPVGKGTIVVAY